MSKKVVKLLLMAGKNLLYISLLQTVFFTSLFAIDVSGQKSIKEVHIDLKVTNASLIEIFEKIESRSMFKFSYFASDVDVSGRVTRRYTNTSIADILADIGKTLGFKFKQVNNVINVQRIRKPVTGKAPAKLPEKISVSGTVTSGDEGERLPGVTVLEKGTANGTATDLEGKFTIVVEEDAVLVFSFVGYSNQEVPVSNRSVIDIVLERNNTQLQEVVITALGISRETRALGYAVSEVKGEDLAEAGQMNVINSLSGKVAGIQVNTSGMSVDGKNRIVIRGATSLSNDNQPLVIVDGIPLQGASPTPISTIPPSGGIANWGSPIADINPQDIESLSVLKGASARWGRHFV